MSTNPPLPDSDPMLDDAPNPQVPVHSFNPNASPSEKAAAAAGPAGDKLYSIIPDAESRPKGLPVNARSSNIVPTITVEDADYKPVEPTLNGLEHQYEMVDDDVPEQLIGAIPTQSADAIPRWYRTGWRAVSGIDELRADGIAKEKRILDTFLSEQYYGDWYHNAGIIVFAVFASHFLARFNFGWASLFVLLAFCSTYYTTSMERMRRLSRDEIQRELIKTRLAVDSETVDWLNNFLDRFWLIYEPVLSQSIVQTVDQILSSSTPAFLDSMRLGDFTLGNKAPRIESVKTYPNTEDDVIIMDWTISFTPNDTSNMTKKQADNKTNPKIVLLVRIGKGLATASMPILVEDITFKGQMKLRLKLMSNFPHVQVVDFCFMGQPVIDFVLKPIGGETFGFDIANIPGLSSFVRETTHATLRPMMYDPNVFTLNLEQLLSGKPLDAAIGVVKITLYGARGLKTTKIGGDIPDPYISINIQNRSELARTKHKQNTFNPTWTETKFLLVNNLNEDLILNLYDYNDHRRDTLLGTAMFKLEELQEDATQENIESRILKDGKQNGELRYDVSFYPVLTPEETDGQLPDSNVGIVRLVIHQAKELDNSKSMSGSLNPLVKVYTGNGKSSYQSPVRKHTNNPVWEAPYEFLCADKASSKIVFKVIDDRDFLKDPELGHMSIKLTDLLTSTGQAGRDWFFLDNCKSGKIRVSAEWKPLNMAGALQGVNQHKPIGVVRLHLDRATDVKNVEATLGGKSDPYVRVLVNSIVKGRTEVVDNDLSPVWDQIIYVPVHSLKETLLLECMDYQHLTKDRHLGSVEVKVSDLAEVSDDPQYPYKSTGKKEAADQILVERSQYKGTMHYTATFIPALNIKGATFKDNLNELSQTIYTTDTDSKSSSSVSSDTPERKVDVLDDVFTPDESNNMESNVPQDNENEEGIEMSRDELLDHQSGIILFKVLSGSLQRKARVEVSLDDGYWPCFSTTRARSTNAQWDYSGEGFMKELDFGLVWLRVNEADEGEKDDIAAVWKGGAKDFLKSTLIAPQTFTLRDPDDENKTVATITIEARYIPVPVVLEARETVNNQGLLHVTLIDGQDIRGVDRSGKSDPFAVFSLNGRKVYKSQVKKKTLNPEWNEDFTVDVTSRVAAEFSLELFDWNQLEQAKSLGTGKINITTIESFQACNQFVSLSTSKHGEQGRVQLSLLFQPLIIVKTRKNTSTFTSAGRTMTQLGGLPIAASKGVFQGVAGVFKHKDRDSESLQDGRVPTSVPFPSAPPPHETPTSDVLEPGQAAFPTKTSIDNTRPACNEPGMLRVVVTSATLSDDSKAYVVLRVGDKEVKTKHSAKTTHPEWNESFNFTAGPFTPKLYAWVHDHKSFGKDKDIGEAEIDLWNNLQLQGRSSKELTVPLRSDRASLKLFLEFDPSINPSSSSISVTSSERVHRTVSFSSPGRFSIRGRRPGAEGDD
ncbi:hypothetical protein AX15_005704 [Amanita polypyramis BW_CC]|nr:hypothetical protein AX15_005704 [Amanita polypyramis BW_CC]